MGIIYQNISSRGLRCGDKAICVTIVEQNKVYNGVIIQK